jgi:ABC-type transport system involved in multi-copper enzyme maturation permease subunit
MLRSARGAALALLAHLVLLQVLLVPAILYWPKLSQNIGVVRVLAPLPLVKDLVARIDQEGMVAYVVLQQFFKACNTLGAGAAVVFAAGAVAGEVSRGTLELFLARPLSRRRVLLERWLLGAVAVVLPVFLSSATIPWLATRVGEEVALAPMMLCAAHQSLFLLALYALVFLCSTAGSQPLRIAVIFLALIAFEYSVYLVSRWTHFSAFRLTDLDAFLTVVEHGLAPGTTLAYLAVIGALLLASLAVFARRTP